MTQTVTGIKEMQTSLSALSKKYSEAIAKGAFAAAQSVRTDAIKSIQSQSSGETVTRYRADGTPYKHTVSKDGDAPNTDTGELVKSVQVEVKPDGIYVGSRLEYAGHLEFRLNRPWLIPALEKNRRLIRNLIGKNVDFITREFNR